MLLTLGQLEVDLAAHQVRRGSSTTSLTPKEAALLGHLAGRPNTDVSREELYDVVWGYRPGALSRTLDTTVHRLRTKLEVNPADPAWLRTVHNHGYRLVVPEHLEPCGELIGRAEQIEQLDRLAVVGGPPVLVHATLGMGKSALLAGWAERLTDVDRVDVSTVPPTLLPERIARSQHVVVVVDGLEGVCPTLSRPVPGRRVVFGARCATGWRGPILRLPRLDADVAGTLIRRQRGTTEPTVPADLLGRVGEEVREPAIARMTVWFASRAEALPESTHTVLALAVEVTGERGEPAPAGLLRSARSGADVERLVDLGWLIPIGAGTPLAYALPWHIGRCARAVLDPGRTVAARERLARWADERAAAIDEGLRTASWSPALRTALPALERACELAEDPEEHAPLALQVDAIYRANGSVLDHRAFLASTLDRTPEHAPLTARLLCSRGHLAALDLDPSAASDFARSAEIARTSGDDALRAESERALVGVWCQEGRIDEAEALVATMRARPGLEVKANSAYAAAWVALSRGRREEAEAYLRESHAAAAAAGDGSLVRESLRKLAVLKVEGGDRAGAAVLVRQAVALAPGGQGRFRAAVALIEGQLAATAGDDAGAEEAWTRALADFDRLDLALAGATCRTNLAWLALGRGDGHRAIELLEESLHLSLPRHATDRIGFARSVLAIAHHVAGNLAEAEELFRHAINGLALVDPPKATLTRVLEVPNLVALGRGSEARAVLDETRDGPDLIGALTRSFSAWVDGDDAPPGPEPYRGVFRHLRR
ncbi:MAG: winged helix-turn-helix domain-containing protein [Myxococcales bacterium]|nr:winged helix-turn-helix domain-containing protein [Myxococcales bacterium]